MNEYILNLHMHTVLSDGEGSYDSILNAALEAGIDGVIVTDHNVWVDGAERVLEKDGRRVTLFIGEEVHNQARDPQKNHLLVFNANKELAPLAADPRELINAVQKSGGVCFLAHPMEDALPAFGETDITWVDWHLSGYTGIELWNGLSEFKTVVHNKLQAVFYAFFPEWIAHGPPPRLLKKWDELTLGGNKVAAIGGSDAHALQIHLGPIFREIFPYVFHFRSINTHLLLSAPASGNPAEDKHLVYAALRQGNCFVGYDLPRSTRGFHFEGVSGDNRAIMGDEILLKHEIEFHIDIPADAECCLIRNGEKICEWKNRRQIDFKEDRPGTYRVECYRSFKGRLRGWIFSNPIYVRGDK